MRRAALVPDPNRGQFNDSVNYYVPAEWRSGTVEFRVELNPDREIPEPDYADNAISKQVTFRSLDPMCVAMVRVYTQPQVAWETDPDSINIMAWVRAALPPLLLYHEGVATARPLPPWVSCFADDPFCGSPYLLPEDGPLLLDRLNRINMWRDPPAGCDQVYYYGMVHASAFPEYIYGGAAMTPGNAAWGVMFPGDAATGAPWYIDGGAIMAQQLGFNLGRPSVDCFQGGDDGYPYDACDIGHDDPTAYYGLIHSRRVEWVVIPPTMAGDLMSDAHRIGKPRWPSDYTYRALFDLLPRPSSARASTRVPEALAQADELLVASGIITPTEGTATLDPFYRLPQGTLSSSQVAQAAARQAVTSADEAYHLSLLDDTGAVLVDHPFQLPRVAGDIGPGRPFHVVMPYHPDTARIILMRDASELASRSVSSHAPSVRVLAPNGGEMITDTLTIQWESQDDDGDPLLYTVQYSPDYGARWEMVAIDYSSTKLSVHTDALPGSQGQALIRVTATDGVNTGIDQSDAPFTLQSHPPRAYITAPEDGAVFDQGSQIIFFGRTFDAEDGPLADEYLAWASDRDGLLGTGLDLAATDLSPGWHTITLEATDSDGQTGTDSMRIFISTARIYLPLISSLSVPTVLSSPTPALAQPARAYRFEWR